MVRVLRQGNTRLILVFSRLRASQTAGTLAVIYFSLSFLQGPLACEELDNLLYEGHTPPVSWESRAQRSSLIADSLGFVKLKLRRYPRTIYYVGQILVTAKLSKLTVSEAPNAPIYCTSQIQGRQKSKQAGCKRMYATQNFILFCRRHQMIC